MVIVPTRSCYVTRPQWYRSAVVLFGRRHPRFWNVNSTIPVDIVTVKSDENGLFYSTGVPMWVSVNKSNLVLFKFARFSYLL